MSEPTERPQPEHSTKTSRLHQRLQNKTDTFEFDALLSGVSTVDRPQEEEQAVKAYALGRTDGEGAQALDSDPTDVITPQQVSVAPPPTKVIGMWLLVAGIVLAFGIWLAVSSLWKMPNVAPVEVVSGSQGAGGDSGQANSGIGPGSRGAARVGNAQPQSDIIPHNVAPTTSIHPDAAGILTLKAMDAAIDGKKAQLEDLYNNPHIAFWTDPHDAVVWSVDTTKEGDYSIEVEFSCANGDGGSTYKIATSRDAEGVIGKVNDTGDWANFKTEMLFGTLHLPAGNSKIWVVPQSMPPAPAASGDHGVGNSPDHSVMELSRMTLIPATKASH